MAIRVYRIVVVGCPRAVLDPEGSCEGVGKSSLCNRFVRSEAYSEAHGSVLTEEEWKEDFTYNGDHFLYWGAATKHLQDGSRARYQIVEQTEFYKTSEEGQGSGVLCAHDAKEGYITRASALRFGSQEDGKVARRFEAEMHAAGGGAMLRATQLFPDKDFNNKSGQGVYGFACVFDPTLDGECMKRQLDYLSELLIALAKRKRKLILVCTKCDAVDETKVRHGSNLANYALKKPIPFIEVSSREGINVEDAFLSIAGPLKKRKVPKNAKRSASGYLTYREAISLRKHDINRAKDAYRRLLQRKVSDFLSVWSEVFPVLEKEPEFSLVLQLGGKEGQEVVKKMFCLRLIEIKLMEASKLFGSSVHKKLDKESSRSRQVYLSEAFKGHPDLGTESIYDYVYSPDASLVNGSQHSTDDTGSEFTEPSTPTAFSSTRNTPDMFSPPSSNPIVTLFRPRTSSRSTDNGSPISFTSKRPSSSVDARPKSAMAGEAAPPPLPSREEVLGASLPLKNSRGDPTTKSQPFLDTVDTRPQGSARRDAESRRLSTSMECLLAPDGGEDSVADLNAEPYLQPIQVQRMLGSLPPLPTLPPIPVNKRDSSQFRSMRAPKQSSRTPLLMVESPDPPTEQVSRSHSLRGRGHRRTQSNPWVLESGIPLPAPPPVPSRNSNMPPQVPPRDIPKHKASKMAMHGDVRPGSFEEVLSPIESSLDFSQLPTNRTFRRSMQGGQDDEEDRFSDISGPFEEIDDIVKSKSRMASKNASLSPAHTRSSLERGKDSSQAIADETDNGQYAKIEEFQQPYVAMAPLGTNSRVPLPSPYLEDTSDLDISRRDHAATFSGSAQSTHWRTSRWQADSDPSLDKEQGTPSRSSTLPASPYRRSITPSEHRPLPPSPTKPVRNISDGLVKKNSLGNSNIYEVIDEDFVAKVKKRQSIDDSASIWSPPIDPQYIEEYLKIIQKFFSIPEVHQHWVNVVQEVLPDKDAGDVPPPFFQQFQGKLLPQHEDEEEEEEEEEEGVSGAEQSLDATDTVPEDKPEASSSGSSSPFVKRSPIAQPKKPKAQDGADDTIPISLPQTVPATAAGMQALRLKDSVPSSSHPSSPRLPVHSTSSTPRLKRVLSRDDVIKLMNQQLNQYSSSDESESDSDDSDTETEGDSDSDSDSDSDTNLSDPDPTKKHGFGQAQSPEDYTPSKDRLAQADQDPAEQSTTPSHFTVKTALIQTDLDDAVRRRTSLSTDSDLTSDTVKSSESNSLENMANGTDGKKGGVVFVPRRRTSGRKAESESRNLSDSGISNCHSQTFEDNLESEC